MERVVVLNADYNFLNVVDWKRAIKLLVNGKCEVVEYHQKKIITATKEIIIPKILRLLKLVKVVFKNHVPLTKKNIMIRDNYQCGYCGTTHGELTIDHVLPKSRGGQLSFTNAVSCCSECNAKKGDRTPAEAGMKLLKPLYSPTVAQFLVKRVKGMELNYSLMGNSETND